jgi:septum formation protein
MGVAFEVRASDVHELRGEGESVTAYVERLAREKAAAVAAEEPEAWVIAADTVVYLDGEVLEKPTGEVDAAMMLGKIAGRQHTVITGVALQNGARGYLDSTVMSTHVTIMPLTPQEIEWYVATGEPMDKAGAYAVQGIGAMFIDSIEGNYTNVVGLPLSVLRHMMIRAGVDPVVRSLKSEV